MGKGAKWRRVLGDLVDWRERRERARREDMEWKRRAYGVGKAMEWWLASR